MRNMLTAIVVLMGLFLCNALAFAAPEAQPQRNPRLIVDNRSNHDAVVEIWRHDGRQWDWRRILDVTPGKWVPLYDVRPGERLRARLKNGVVLYHTARLESGQDVWWLQNRK